MKSSYYPPRAQLPSNALGVWFYLRRAMRLERIEAALGISLWRIILSLVIPGYAFAATGRHHLGRIVTSACAGGVLVFFILLGHAITHVIFGLLMAAHAVSISWLLRLWVDRLPLWLKLAMGGTLLAFLSVAFYWPSIRYMEEHWFLPVATRSGIVVVERTPAPENVGRGDLVAFRIHQDRRENMLIREGLAIGRVLATGGAKVEFFSDAFFVDGKPHRRRPRMPGQGSFVVPQNHWFIWPDVDIQLNGAATEAMAATALLRVATVSQNNYVGRPYRRWFGRSQRIP